MIGNRLVTGGLGGQSLAIGGLAEPREIPVALTYDAGTLSIPAGGGTLSIAHNEEG